MITFKPRLPATLAAAAFALAGCASGPEVRGDYDKAADFGKYRSYGFVAQAGTDTGDVKSLATQILQNAASRGEEVEWPTRAEVNYRASNALIGDGDAIVIPADSWGRVEFEGELVAVIGKRAKRLSRENALDSVFGYTIGNDVSERSWQKSDRSFWRSKNCDTFEPMGPWIETDVDLALMESDFLAAV